MTTRYDKYYDSGIEWLGKLPEGWEVKKIKHNWYVNSRIRWKSSTSRDLADAYSYLVSRNDFINDNIYWEGCAYINQGLYEEDPAIQLKNGDLLITKDGNISELAIVRGLNKPACLNSGIFTIRSKRNSISTNYLFWVLKSNVFKHYNEYTSYGSRIHHHYKNKLLNFCVSYPSYIEQTAISTFLDRRTGEIAQLIDNKKNLITLYEEERKYIINEAVTRGLNSNVKMKHSGVELVGVIPEHWEMKRLKYVVSKVESGVTPKGGASQYQSSGIPFLRSQNIYFDGLRLDDLAFITQNIHEEMSNSKLLVGDILLSLTGASIGECYYVDETLGEANISQHVGIIRSKENIKSKYLYFLLLSKIGQEQISTEKTGRGREGLNLEAIKNFSIPLVYIKEQSAIIAYIEFECYRLNTIIDKFSKQIELLEEYRTTLISNVVTGKVDVRKEGEI